MFALFLKRLGNQAVTVVVEMLKINVLFLCELTINPQHICVTRDCKDLVQSHGQGGIFT